MLETYGSILLSKKKFLLILREPISRHYSEYQMRVRVCLGAFKPKKKDEDQQRIYRNCDKITSNYIDWIHLPVEEQVIDNLHIYTFAQWLKSEDGSAEIERGHYIQHIMAWLDYVNRNQLFILNFSSVINKTGETMTALSKFLGLKTDWGKLLLLLFIIYYYYLLFIIIIIIIIIINKDLMLNYHYHLILIQIHI